jgi:hypothetical protein
MSETDLIAVTHRFNIDSKFAGQLLRNFDEAVQGNGYSLDEEEMNKAKAAFSAPGSVPTAGAVSGTTQIPQPFQPFSGDQQLHAAQLKRMIDVGEFTVSLLKSTLNNARFTYQLITLMNGLMFCMGGGLFLFAAIYGAASRDLTFTAAFAGLGAASFVALFMLGPIDKTQEALSNLIQAEVAFMNYYDQMCLLEGCAQLPSPGSNVPCVENLEKASALLQKRTEETISLLQTYLENRPARDGSRSKLGRDSKTKRVGAPSATHTKHQVKETQPLAGG